MNPEWEDIEPWQDPRWDFIASGYIRRYTPDQLDEEVAELREELDRWGNE